MCELGLDVDLMLLSADEMASELGARVRRERLRQNMTQRTLADRAGVTPLAHARQRGFTQIITILESAGAR